MKPNRRSWGLCSRICAAAIGIISLATPASAEGLKPVKIGLIPLTSSSPIFIARDKGYFKAEGLDAEILPFDAAQPIAVAVAAGDVQFGTTAFTAGFFNLAGNGSLKIIAGESREVPGYRNQGYLVYPKVYDAGLKSPRDLPGHSLGVTQVGSNSHLSLGLWAEKAGFPVSRVKVVPLQTLGNVAAAVKTGRIDTALLPVAVAQPLIDSGSVKVIGWVGDLTPWQLAGIFAAPSTLADRDATTRFLTALRKANAEYYDTLLKDYQGKPTPVDDRTRPLLEIISRNIKQPVEKVARILPYIDPEGRLDVASIRRIVAWFQREKFVKPGFTGDDVIDPSFGFTEGK